MVALHGGVIDCGMVALRSGIIGCGRVASLSGGVIHPLSLELSL